jgi:hypothetical protein
LHYGKDEENFGYTMRDGKDTRVLKELEEEKDLGVLFDKSLAFGQHVGAIVNKATRVVGVIKRSFDHMDEEMFKTLYKSMVRTPAFGIRKQCVEPLLEERHRQIRESSA